MEQREAAQPSPTNAAQPPDAQLPVLHAVTSDDIILRTDFAERARRVMHAGGPRVAVHLRAARFSARYLYDLACRLAAWQNETGAWLIVNDRADLALTAGARGIQLTSRSMSPADARRCAPDVPVGASVHSSADAADAVSAGARWIVAGHVFETESHPGEKGRGGEFIGQLARDHAVPVIAIGGVRPEHVGGLRRDGAYGVAVIRGVWYASDAGAAVIDYLSAHGAHGGQ